MNSTHQQLEKRLEVLRRDWMIADEVGKRFIEKLAADCKRQLAIPEQIKIEMPAENPLVEEWVKLQETKSR